jgi:hypothetical protein
MPDSTTYSMPEDPPFSPCEESTDSDIFGALDVRQYVSIYHLARLIQGMMLSSMDSKGARPDYNDPGKIFDLLRTELRMRGQQWTGEYLNRCHEVSITDPSRVEGVPLATRGQDTLYDAAIVHAGEMFWPFVERHATVEEVRQMGEMAQRAYENGDSVRRIPAALAPENQVRLFPEFPGRPSWLGDEEARRCNRLKIQCTAEDPFVPEDYSGESRYAFH